MSEETIRLKVSLNIGISNAEQADVIETGIPVSEWSALTDEEREKRGHEEWQDWIWQHVDGGWEVVDS